MTAFALPAEFRDSPVIAGTRKAAGLALALHDLDVEAPEAGVSTADLGQMAAERRTGADAESALPWAGRDVFAQERCLY